MDYQFVEQILKMIGASSYQFATIESYIEEVIDYMVDAGVSREIANSRKCIGTVTRGVMDLWNYGSGDVSFSQYFKERVTQLSYANEKENPGYKCECVEPITTKEIEEILEK